ASLTVQNSIDSHSTNNTAGSVSITGDTTGTLQFNTLGLSSALAINTSAAGASHFAGDIKIILTDTTSGTTPVGNVQINGGITTAGTNSAQSGNVIIAADQLTLTSSGSL